MIAQPNEADRLAALHRTGLLDTEPTESFDRVTRLAARALNVPAVAISLVDTSRLWIKSRYGCEIRELARDSSFCTHTVSRRQPLIVPDAALDVRFASSPLVVQPPNIRAYLGIPLFVRDGHAVGALCALDSRPREFGHEDVAMLSDFARIAEDAAHAQQLATQHRDPEPARQAKQLQVANDALRAHVKRLVESERAARTAEQRIRAIADGVPVMIAYWNRHLHCEFANEGYREWFGIPPQQIVGMSMSDLMGDGYRDVDAYVRGVLQGHAQRFEHINLPRPGDGKPVCLEIRYLPDIAESGEVRGFFALGSDATAWLSRPRE